MLRSVCLCFRMFWPNSKRRMNVPTALPKQNVVQVIIALVGNDYLTFRLEARHRRAQAPHMRLRVAERPKSLEAPVDPTLPKAQAGFSPN